MNLNPFKSIYNFNKEAGLLDKGYNDERECAFPIEEALEGLDDLQYGYDAIGMTPEAQINNQCTPKDISRYIIDMMTTSTGDPIEDVDRLDKHLDIIVFSLGSIYKLGLSPQEAMKALGIVAEANLQKLTVGQDSEGKQLKPEGFIPPEAKLQKILDERTE